MTTAAEQNAAIERLTLAEYREAFQRRLEDEHEEVVHVWLRGNTQEVTGLTAYALIEREGRRGRVEHHIRYIYIAPGERLRDGRHGVLRSDDTSGVAMSALAEVIEANAHA